MFKKLFQILSQKNLMMQALDKSEEALGKSQTITRAAFEALMDQSEPEIDVYAVDREINQAEVEVRRMVLEHLAMRDDGDLTASLVLLSAVTDIERIGDYAKNVYDQVERGKTAWPNEGHFVEVREMVGRVLENFDRVGESLRDGNVEVARAVMDSHQEVSQRCESIIDDIVLTEEMKTRDAVMLALTARFLKRISAHLSNLASTVVNPFDRIGFRPGEGKPLDADR